MKTTLLTILVSILVGYSAEATEKAKMDPKMEKMMEEWKKYATPSEGHKIFEQMKGNWNYKSKMWHSADAKPEESKGSSTMTLALGGRYLEQNFKGTAGGQKFEGKGTLGYDNLQKKYVSTWIDNMGTGMMHATGTFDSETKTLADSGEMSCPMSKDNKKLFRSEWKLIDKNNMVFAMYAPGEDGEEFKEMEITYKRK